MTTSAVSKVGLFSTGQSAATTVKNEQNDSFSQIFASQAETKAETDTEVKTQSQNAKTDNVQDTKESTMNEEVKETEAATEVQDSEEVSKEETEVISKEQTEEVLSKEELEKAVAELMTTIQEVMNVSPQQLQSALDELGITAEELLDTKNIQTLVVALTEGADELSVMTNEAVFTNVQEITAKAEELLTDLSVKTGMSFEEIQTAIAKMSQPQTEMVSEEPVVYQAAAPSDSVSTEERAVVLENNQLEHMQAAVVNRTEDVAQNSTNDNMQRNANDQQMTFAQTVVDQLEQAVAKTETVTTSYTTTTESVMNQIQDAIRVIQTQDMTEMELQLHPASLGSLRIQIAAKEGVITAVFTTENEAVRAALESQLVTLKENFAQQGVRVEAVEVTVASHAFEQNLNGDENHAGEQTANEKKKGSRRITLSDMTMDNIEEELSDEDRIVAEMMKENGNTVDYTV